jgi:hypothetical protein
MYRVKKVEALAGFRLAVEFEDGVSGGSSLRCL